MSAWLSVPICTDRVIIILYNLVFLEKPSKHFSMANYISIHKNFLTGLWWWALGMPRYWSFHLLQQLGAHAPPLCRRVASNQLDCFPQYVIKNPVISFLGHDVKRIGKNHFIPWFRIVPFYSCNMVNLTSPLLVVFHLVSLFFNILWHICNIYNIHMPIYIIYSYSYSKFLRQVWEREILIHWVLFKNMVYQIFVPFETAGVCISVPLRY